eukprot:8267131-Pyramimonas_sp.AAC.1
MAQSRDGPKAAQDGLKTAQDASYSGRGPKRATQGLPVRPKEAHILVRCRLRFPALSLIGCRQHKTTQKHP